MFLFRVDQICGSYKAIAKARCLAYGGCLAVTFLGHIERVLGDFHDEVGVVYDGLTG